jgi:epoxyqueuosine reductase QueG
LAGLGWIGKSCSLISPHFGPRLRLVTVLTNAPLKAGQRGRLKNQYGFYLNTALTIYVKS